MIESRGYKVKTRQAVGKAMATFCFQFNIIHNSAQSLFL